MTAVNPNAEVVCKPFVVCCPDELPETLTATFTNVSGCGNLNTKTISLVHNSVTGKWEATATICNDEWTLTFYCNPVNPDCTGFRLDWAITQNGCGTSPTSASGMTPDSGCTCTATTLSVVFSQGMAASGCGCCDGQSTNWKVTITR
ncbi:MAG: hypothetical protein ACE5KM_09565 [Planctomycetaceae bacterium]